MTGCEDNENSENEVKISKNYDDDSHKTGKNCMNCHIKGESGEGWFTVAGTVYDSLQATINPNGMVNLYSSPGSKNDALATIEVDALGNFFTTEPINLENGLYVSVFNSDGIPKSMISPVTNGSCNDCHDGVAVDRIWVR
jgi:hypothetical protein